MYYVFTWSFIREAVIGRNVDKRTGQGKHSNEKKKKNLNISWGLFLFRRNQWSFLKFIQLFIVCSMIWVCKINFGNNSIAQKRYKLNILYVASEAFPFFVSEKKSCHQKLFWLFFFFLFCCVFCKYLGNAVSVRPLCCQRFIIDTHDASMKTGKKKSRFRRHVLPAHPPEANIWKTCEKTKCVTENHTMVDEVSHAKQRFVAIILPPVPSSFRPLLCTLIKE